MSRLKLVSRICRLTPFMLSASMSTHAQVVARFDALDPLGTARKTQVVRQRAIAIEVAPGEWGGADIRDIKRVLDSAAAELLPHIGAGGDELRIRVIPRSGSPRVLYERGAEGQYVVQLTARDEHWFQYVYQFAHELCHVLSNFANKESQAGGKVSEDNQWFEESLCETASLFTLRRLALAWESRPPTRNWSGYGSTFSAYAARLLGESHRRLPAGRSLRDWYAENRADLTANPYQREKNELVAATLLPLFEGQPELWRSIPYLNPTRASAGKPFAQYLADWQAASPDKALPDQVIELFGLPDRGQTEAKQEQGGVAGEKVAASPLVPRIR